MKELTIEQKAKRFDEVLAMAKECITYVPDDAVNKYMLNMFPELRESGDERIRKAIIEEFRVKGIGGREDKFFRNGIKIKDAIDWLEKQGTSYTKTDVDDAYLKGVTDTKNEIEKQYEANYQIRKDIATFIFNYRGDIKDRAKWMNYLGIKVSFVDNQGEPKPQGKSALEAVKEEKVDNQNCVKPTDKVEPKFNFKVGQWVVATGKCVYLISKIDFFAVTLVDTNGDEYVFDVSSLDDAHQWTLADAKDGDMIYVSTEGKGIQAIFKSYDDNYIYFHCYLCRDFNVDGWLPIGDIELIYPLQKIHYNRFFQKMKEAGYKWDAEKKELKKIGDKTEILFGAKDSELQEVTYYIPKGFHAEIDEDKVVIKKGEKKPTDEEMKELLRTEYEKGRADAIAETQVAWSDEDKRHVESILERLEGMCKKGATYIATRFAVNQDIDWLKSLKPQPKQERSEEDERMLDLIIAVFEVNHPNGYFKANELNDPNMRAVYTKEIVDWLKSLKPHTQWKPSEKQMEALDYYANSLCTYCDRQDDLRSLYNDLKKLKEE